MPHRWLNCACQIFNLAREDYWRKRFEERNRPIIGDDIKSQVGSTIIHRVLTRLFQERGVHLDHTYQLNFGGNTDFLNMLERERLISKKISKTNSVLSQMQHPLAAEDVHIGPSDYVPWLKDRKWAHIRMEGKAFGDVPLTVDLKLEVHDSPNSAGIVIDAVRCSKLALDRGLSGTLEGPSSYFMKSPPYQVSDERAHELTRGISIAGRVGSGLHQRSRGSRRTPAPGSGVEWQRRHQLGSRAGPCSSWERVLGPPHPRSAGEGA